MSHFFFFLFFLFRPYTITACGCGEEETDIFYTYSEKSAIQEYMDKWYASMGSCGGPFCLEVDGKEYEVIAEITFTIHEGRRLQ